MTTTNGQRAFTLLEVLVSSTILVSAVTLMSLVWAQASDWRVEAEGHASAVQASHVGAALQRQWATRRAHVHLDDADGPSERLIDDRFEFVTATPLLYPDHGLVRASFVVAADQNEGYALHYEERLVTAPALSVSADSAAVESESMRGTALLTDCPALGWERYIQILDDQAVETVFAGWVSDAELEALADGASQIRTLAYRLRGEHERRIFEWVLDDAALR